jgi:hypothetical protein
MSSASASSISSDFISFEKSTVTRDTFLDVFENNTETIFNRLFEAWTTQKHLAKLLPVKAGVEKAEIARHLIATTRLRKDLETEILSHLSGDEGFSKKNIADFFVFLGSMFPKWVEAKKLLGLQSQQSVPELGCNAYVQSPQMGFAVPGCDSAKSVELMFDVRAYPTLGTSVNVNNTRAIDREIFSIKKQQRRIVSDEFFAACAAQDNQGALTPSAVATTASKPSSWSGTPVRPLTPDQLSKTLCGFGTKCKFLQQGRCNKFHPQSEIRGSFVDLPQSVGKVPVARPVPLPRQQQSQTPGMAINTVPKKVQKSANNVACRNAFDILSDMS